MLKKIQIKNFKNFKDEITFDFSDVHDYEFNRELIKNKLINKAVLYGPNNSGKSNLGAAIMDITLHLTDNEGKGNPIYVYYQNGNSTRSAEFTYTFVFDKKEVVYHYKKRSALEVTFEELLVENETIFRYDYVSKQYVNNIEEAATIDISKNNTGMDVLKYIYKNTIYWDNGSPVRCLMDFVDNMLWFRSLQHNEFIGTKTEVESLHDYVIKNHLIKDFEKFLADCGQNFILSEMPYANRQVLSVKYDKVEAPFNMVVSNGTLSLWLFYYWMTRSGKGISFLYLDEFDAFYNYGLSEHILRYVNQKSSFQSVLTTHNVYLLDNELMRPDCYFIINDGKIASLASRTNKTIRQAHNLEKMFLGGEFEA